MDASGHWQRTIESGSDDKKEKKFKVELPTVDFLDFTGKDRLVLGSAEALEFQVWEYRKDPKKVASLTLRQRTELHRSNAVCANCHKVLDPIGFGLENFDAIGRWRDKDDESGGRIDATGELPGGHHFGTPAELKRVIAGRKDDFCRTLTGKLLAYALCHQLEGYDEVVVDQLADAVAKDDYRMQTLVVGVVTSYPFTHRLLNSQGDPSHAK